MKSNSNDAFMHGYNLAIDNLASISGSYSGKNYVDGIKKAIMNSQEELNGVVYGYKSSPESMGGYFAEAWHTEIYNIDAAVKVSDTHAWIPERVGGIKETFAQPDISIK